MTSIKAKSLQSHDDVLSAIADGIDIPEHLEDSARSSYKSIGEWLERESSTLRQYAPEISPQGSFLLGTVTRPVGDTDDYDIDVVCKLNAAKSDFTMAQLKAAVGAEIKSYAKAHGMNYEPIDGRRCWTLNYADGARFHLDILPALPNASAYRKLLEDRGYRELAANAHILEAAIAITDKTHPCYRVLSEDWPVSNPKGYGVWFKSRQREILDAGKRAIMERERIYARVDDVPDHKVKTPLQRSIQLLKRHRDTMFNGDEHKPISIIITTLAAQAYQGEAEVGAALRTILKSMDRHIEQRGQVKWVANPVNPDENFADKWSEGEKGASKEANFHSWLAKARRDFGLYLSASSFSNIPETLQESLTATTVKRVLPSVAAPAIMLGEERAKAEANKIASQGGATRPWRK